MNIPQSIKDIGGIAAAITACWLVWDKIEIPDTVAPATVGYVNGKVDPLEQGNRNDAKNWALRNIPYAWDKICAGAKPDRLNELYESVLLEYANYEWATGHRHRYSDMSKAEICNERKE